MTFRLVQARDRSRALPRTAPFDRDPPGGGEGSLPNHLLRAASDRDPQVVPGLPTLISKAHRPGPVLERPGAPGAGISEGAEGAGGEPAGHVFLGRSNILFGSIWAP